MLEMRLASSIRAHPGSFQAASVQPSLRSPRATYAGNISPLEYFQPEKERHEMSSWFKSLARIPMQWSGAELGLRDSISHQMIGYLFI